MKKDLSISRVVNGRYTEATEIKGKKAIFFSLPKNANTSIRKVINKQNGLNQKLFQKSTK